MGRAEDLDLHLGEAPHPERHLGTARLVDRPVTDEPHVGGQALPEFGEVLREVGRALLLLALEQHDDGGATVLDRIQGGQERHDRSAVVGRAPGVEAPIGVDGISRLRERDDLPTVLEPRVTQRGGERRGRPLGRVDRLAVVVGVDPDDGPVGVARDPPVHDGRRGPDLVDLEVEPASGELGGDPLRGAAEPVGIGRHVRDRHELGERPEDRSPLGVPMAAGAVDGGHDGTSLRYSYDLLTTW